METIKNMMWVNKLTVFFHLGNVEEFDKLYYGLPIPFQMLQGVVRLKLEALLEQNKPQEAIHHLKLAENYHKSSDGTTPHFIEELRELVDDAGDIEMLRATYNAIFSKLPSTLIRILPQKLNGEIEMGRFLAKEVALAADKVLDKIQSLKEIRLEDKYNDMIQMALDSRLGVFGWIVKDQSRGGLSESGLGLGERDIVIQSGNHDTFMVCEAFIYRSHLAVQSHLEKVFNYHHKRNHFIILIYDTGKYEKFKVKWKGYLNKVLPSLSYPSEYGINKKAIEDMTVDFDYGESGIKIGKSVHGDSTTIYHIMMSVDYAV